jgi:hypothetical protein
LLLAGDRCMDATKAFEVNQAVDLVPCRELTLFSLLMLEHAAFEVSGDAGVRRFGAVGHDVDVVEVGLGNA